MAVLIKRAAGIAKGSGEPNKNKVGKITRQQVEEIAEAQAARPQLRDAWTPRVKIVHGHAPAAWASRVV